MTTTRATFKHAWVYTLAAVTGKMISFFLLPFYAHVLQDVGYGVIGMIEASLAFLFTLMSYGVQSAVTRFYYDRPPEERNRVVSTGMLQTAAISTALCLPLMLASGPLSGWLLGDASMWHLLVLAMLGFVFELTGTAASAILLIEQRSTTFSVIGLARLLIGVATSIWFVLVLDWGLFGYFLSGTLTTLISSVWFVTIAVRRCGAAWDRGISRDLFFFQLPLVPGNLASFVSRQAERVLVRYQLDLASVGVLEMGYKFPSLISLMITQPFMKSWNTTRTAMADEPGAPEHIGRVFTWYLLLVASVGLVIVVNIPAVLRLLTPPEFWNAHRIARVEVLTMILQGCYWHVTFGMYYAKDMRSLSWIRGVTSAVKVALSVLFIKLWGLFGAAYSAALIQAVMLFWSAPLAQRKYRIRYEWRKIWLIGVSSAVAFVVLITLDLEALGAYRWLRDVAVPGVGRALAATPLGTWKEGKAVTLLLERADLMSDLVLRTLLCLPYALLIPTLHYETRTKILKRLRGLRRR